MPPSAFYISPTEGREGQVISINMAAYFHAGQLSAMNTRAPQGANIFTMVDSNIPTAHNLLAYILFSYNMYKCELRLILYGDLRISKFDQDQDQN